MKRGLIIILLLVSVCSVAQDEKVNEEKAVIEAALNYVEGAYQGDSARMAKSLYPGLNKVMVEPLPRGGEILIYTTIDLLLEGANAGLFKVTEVENSIKVDVLKIHDNIAAARVATALSTDVINLGKINGKWMIVNVSWISQQLIKGVSRPDDKEKIKATALDYVDGFYSSDPARLENGVHNSLHKVVARKLPNGREFFDRMDKLALVQYAKNQIGGMPAEKREISVEILDITENMAAVFIASGRFSDLVLMSYINGKWQIVNVIWTPNNK